MTGEIWSKHDKYDTNDYLSRSIEKGEIRVAKFSIVFHGFDHSANKKIVEELNAKIIDEMPNTPNLIIVEDLSEQQLEQLELHPDVVKVQKSQGFSPAMAQSVEWSLPLSGIPEFHNRGYTGLGVRVGVIDSGFRDHEDMTYAYRYSVTGGDVTNDWANHGTSCAGIIGMRNNTLGYLGVAPDAELYCIAMDQEIGFGNGYSGADIARAIDHLIGKQVKVISISLAKEINDSGVEAAINIAVNKGILVIASAGNSGEEARDINNQVMYPAKLSNVIAVGAVKRNRDLAKYSARGGEINVVAPGDGVRAPSGTSFTGYQSFNGTSCAAPFVAGLAALFWQQYPNYTASQIRNLIETNVYDIGKDGFDKSFGKGMVISPWTTITNYPGRLTSNAVILTNTGYNGSIASDKYIVHHKYTPQVTGKHLFFVDSATVDTVMNVYDDNYNMINYDDDNGSGTNPAMVVNLTAGQMYYVKVASYGTSTGVYSLKVLTPDQLTILEDTFEPGAPHFDYEGDWRQEKEAQSGTYCWGSKSDTRTKSSTKFTVKIPSDANTPLLIFHHKMNADSRNTMEVIINGERKFLRTGTFGSSTTIWSDQPKQIELVTGDNTIEFVYNMLGSAITGSNQAYIDNLAVVFYSPFSKSGESIDYPIAVNGTSANGTLKDTKDLFFMYTAPHKGSYTFTTSSGFDAYMEIISSNKSTVLGKDDDGAGDGQPKVVVPLSAGDIVYAKVYGYSHSAGKYGPVTLNITLPKASSANISEGFEGSKYAFNFTGDWADSKVEASTGTWSRRSKTINHKETSTMQFTESIPTNYTQTPTLKFDYFVSSEANYDYLEVLVNGVSKLKASGETGWVKDYSVTLGTGNQTVTFNYVKDGSTSKGQDCAYVDNIRVTY
ncbi:S8 family peptidase [Brevibacillus reuszeri]|uniref:S8 family peptidase n=1 Tax=Brevibacillus reuszeri TaxID=54915 RepID=UPI003D21A391